MVIIRIKGEHLLYSKISGRMIGYGWGNVCYFVNFLPGEYLLYSKVSGGKDYYIATSNHSGGIFVMRKVYYTTPVDHGWFSEYFVGIILKISFGVVHFFATPVWYESNNYLQFPFRTLPITCDRLMSLLPIYRLSLLLQISIMMSYVFSGCMIWMNSLVYGYSNIRESETGPPGMLLLMF
jgi:hypothetical protein